MVVILVIVPCALRCVQQMMDKTIKEAFVVQGSDVQGKKNTEKSQDVMQFSADLKLLYDSVKDDEGFDLRSWNRDFTN